MVGEADDNADLPAKQDIWADFCRLLFQVTGGWIEVTDEAHGDPEFRAKQIAWVGFCRVMFRASFIIAIVLILMATFVA